MTRSPRRLAGPLVLAGIALVSCPPPPAAAMDERWLLERVVIQEDFQHDRLGEFASYPPAQDNGYDPSLAPTARYAAPGGRALMRELRPTAAGPLTLGFIRQSDLASDPALTIEFRYRLEPRQALRGAGAAGDGPALEVGLAGADGRRYVARTAGRSGEWETVRLQAADFHADGRGDPLPPAVRLDAFYVVAELPDATPEVTYRFLIDDIRISARRPARFDVHSPAAQAVAAGSALTATRGFSPGDAIAIDATIGLTLAAADCILLDPDGREIARVPLEDRSGTRWARPDVHAVRATDPRGIWTAVLEGRAADGARVTTRVRFLVTDREAPPHPRLFFGAADRERLRAQRAHPEMEELWARTLAQAKASRETGPIAHGGEVFELLGREHLLPTLLGYFDVINRARARIQTNALVAWVEPDEEAFAAARQAMLDVAEWGRWEPPWFTASGQHTYYPAGLLAAAVALGYDLLHDQLTEDERGRIRRALVDRVILPTWREYVVDNRIAANTSNWISHTVGGAILAAAAIAGDGTPEENAALHLPLNGLLLKIEAHMEASYLADGSYGEGISYLEFNLDTLAPMLHAVERVFGHSYWEQTHVLSSLGYPLHTLAQPPSASLDQGDSHPPAGHGIGPLVARSEDPVVRWYGQRFEPRTIWDFLIFSDRVAPQPPSGHGSRLFDVKGNAVFRTGWGEHDAIVLFRAGPTFNHNHNDQGAFLIHNFGQRLVGEAGWSDYYRDPYYATFFIQPIGHSTLLVDGHPESQVIADNAQFAALDRYPRLTDYVSSAFYDAVGAELSPVYPRLSRYTRRLAFLKPDLMVVFDRVRAHAPARYNVLLHVPDRARATATSDAAGLFEGERATLALRAFASEPTTLSLRDGHIDHRVFASRTPPEVPAHPAFFDLETTRPATGAWVISALAMQPRTADAEALAEAVEPVAEAGWTGIRVDRGGRREAVLFRAAGEPGPLAFEGWSTDAETLMTAEGPEDRRFGVQRARLVERDGRRLLAADAPVDAAVEVAGGRVAADLRSDAETTLQLTVEARPRRVTLDGRDLPSQAWRYAGGELTLALPAGESRVVVESDPGGRP